MNVNAATALTSAVISKTVDPSAGDLQFALCSALNDTNTLATHVSTSVPTPTGIGSWSSGNAPQAINVPSPQNLAAGAAPNAANAQGIWLRLYLTAGLAAGKTSGTMRIAGSTT